ncbi:phosphate signaling complex protein PhoU [Alkalibacter saccharofermentans]|uniref:Phosphate-specific transport system accessory protein PhoU n=1 Tax=Alkalibacter saccharofermentans DSM 14828 TaxID=1120975 RepID=A0A1M4YUJ1_9FIRM|nr:phosphate signaling complex protein PhoU [Alkalibacter saccharofermentans]SHF09152.1 phosphate uptake regulator, PhoU [Alkalibacter saccharofermentans DSM 14828]
MRDMMIEKTEEIHRKIREMSELSSKSIEMAMMAFISQNEKMANDVIMKDKVINAYEQEIENLCVTFAATQSPVASDLRRFMTVLRVVVDLERIGDYSCNIAQIVMDLGKYGLIKPIEDLKIMESRVKEMLDDSLKAYFNQDVELAFATAEKDEVIDQLYEKIYRELLSYIKKVDDEEDQIIGLVFVGRYLERIADHATNICERLIYMETGNSVKF